MSNQDEPGRSRTRATAPRTTCTPTRTGRRRRSTPGRRPSRRPTPTDAAETSSYGTPPTHSPYGGPPAPPTQPYAAQPPAYGQDPYAQQSGPYGQPAQPGQYGGYVQPGYAAPPPHPQATTALVLGMVSLIGLFVCLFPILAAPFAWRTGGRVVKEIDAQPGRWSGREQAQAGRIMGMIGTILLVLGTLAIDRAGGAALRRVAPSMTGLRLGHGARVGLLTRYSSQPTSTGSLTSRTPYAASTPSRTSRASASRSSVRRAARGWSAPACAWSTGWRARRAGRGRSPCRSRRARSATRRWTWCGRRAAPSAGRRRAGPPPARG